MFNNTIISNALLDIISYNKSCPVTVGKNYYTGSLARLTIVFKSFFDLNIPNPLVEIIGASQIRFIRSLSNFPSTIIVSFICNIILIIFYFIANVNGSIDFNAKYG